MLFIWLVKQKIIKWYILPNLLSFILDLSNENEKDENQYNNLIILKDRYKHLIKEEIIIDKISYKLVGTINQHTINHYTSCIINNMSKIKFLDINKSYYYEGKDGSNKLFEFFLLENETINEHVLKLKPLILFYLKNKYLII